MVVRPWTTHDVRALKAFAPHGSTACALVLERSRSAVESQARTLGIYVQSSASDEPLTGEMRRILAAVEVSLRLPLCPICHERPATYRPEGVCRVCWLDRCIAACDEEAIGRVQQREFAAARQRKHRRRTCSVCSAVWSPRGATSETRCPRCR